MTTIFNKIPEVIKLIDGESQAILHEEPPLVENDIKDSMNAPHGGRIYKRRTVQHQASAPGEAPAIDTGGLVGSFVKRYFPHYSEIYTDAEQSRALEYCRPEGGLLPRPFMKPAADKSLKRIVERVHKLAGRIKNV